MYMKLMTNPTELEWVKIPLPSANLCHPDSRIIIWNNVGNEYIETFVCYPHPNQNYWVDNKNKCWAPSHFKLDSMQWAWFKRF